MQVPLEIAFHNMEPSDFIEAKVRERVDKLERYFDRITRCSVSIEAPHRAHRQGNLYHVRIEISVPGKDLVVSRDPGDLHAHKDVYVAIRDAFSAAERQLAEYTRKPSRASTP
jgi:ribosomal subunit interface protein